MPSLPDGLNGAHNSVSDVRGNLINLIKLNALSGRVGYAFRPRYYLYIEIYVCVYVCDDDDNDK